MGATLLTVKRLKHLLLEVKLWSTIVRRPSGLGFRWSQTNEIDLRAIAAALEMRLTSALMEANAFEALQKPADFQ